MPVDMPPSPYRRHSIDWLSVLIALLLMCLMVIGFIAIWGWVIMLTIGALYHQHAIHFLWGFKSSATASIPFALALTVLSRDD